MNPLLSLKCGVAILLVAALIGLGFQWGGIGPRAHLAAYKIAVEAQHEAQLTAVIKAMDLQRTEAAAELARRQGVIDAYDQTKSAANPASVGLARRVYDGAARPAACRSDVPQAGPVAGRTQAPLAIPGGDPSLIGRLQELIDACTADARQLDAVVKLAP